MPRPQRTHPRSTVSPAPRRGSYAPFVDLAGRPGFIASFNNTFRQEFSPGTFVFKVHEWLFRIALVCYVIFLLVLLHGIAGTEVLPHPG